MAIRLFLNTPLNIGNCPPLTANHILYLQSVMRCKTGDVIQIFNGIDGEFSGRLDIQKKSVSILIETKIRNQKVEQGPRLYFAPIRKKRLEWMVEKATELGVSQVTPVVTQYAAVREVNEGRLRSISIEAAEQCERMTVPQICPEMKLIDLLQKYGPDNPLIVCDERCRENVPLITTVDNPQRRSLLVGPEGGFSPEEFALMDCQGVEYVSLGSHILRAETASIVGISALMLRE